MHKSKIINYIVSAASVGILFVGGSFASQAVELEGAAAVIRKLLEASDRPAESKEKTAGEEWLERVRGRQAVAGAV